MVRLELIVTIYGYYNFVLNSRVADRSSQLQRDVLDKAVEIQASRVDDVS